jgi:hypothetical protein
MIRNRNKMKINEMYQLCEFIRNAVPQYNDVPTANEIARRASEAIGTPITKWNVYSAAQATGTTLPVPPPKSNVIARIARLERQVAQLLERVDAEQS